MEIKDYKGQNFRKSAVLLPVLEMNRLTNLNDDNSYRHANTERGESPGAPPIDKEL